MYSIAICDDDEICCKMNLELIREYKALPGKNISISVYERGKHLINSGISFDVVILDIDMPGMSGMEVASQLRDDGYDGYIIFVTSHETPVFESFKYNTFRYLVKPLKRQDLFEALDTIFKEIEEHNDQYLVANTDAKNMVRINLEDIKYIETFNRKTIFHLTKREVETVMKMKEVESALEDHAFFKTHKCYMLNLKYVRSFDKSNIYLRDETMIPISRLKYGAFKDAYYTYIKE